MRRNIYTFVKFKKSLSVLVVIHFRLNTRSLVFFDYGWEDLRYRRMGSD